MSKQLLHSYKTHLVIAALSNQAFAVVADKEDASTDARVYELMPPVASSAVAPTKKKTKTDDDGAKKDGSVDDNNIAVKANDEIQAVGCTETNSRIWLAVSREDKTLSLYCVAGTDVNQLNPVAIYKMPKRSRCLLFGTVPSRANNNGGRIIIIAGDLSGDSYAYPIPSFDSIDTSAEVVAKPSSRRLLLGHTASMLTGMKIAPFGKDQQCILTADRDEKVRVSFFPETHVIHGYLLGHTAFVSAMDAVSESGNDVRSLCLTGSGDGTVRLWDYQSCKEVGMVPVVLKDSDKAVCTEHKEAAGDKTMEDTNNSDENEDESVEFDSECGDDDSEEDYEGLIAVPLAVAISSDAKYAVVAREGIFSLDIHPIPIPDLGKKTTGLSSIFKSQLISMHKKQTLGCPSQPLDISFLSDGSVLVLVREPAYILHFKCFGSEHEFKDLTSSSQICSALAAVATSQKISMPTSALEYNEEGTLKLQKKVDSKEPDNDADEAEDGNGASKGGHHWNDKERRNTHRLANGRRRKRKLKQGKKDEE